MTYKEIVYAILDEAKSISDDSFITEEFARFLASRYRTYLLAQTYKDIKKQIPQSNYQTICLDLEETNTIDGEPCTGGTMLRSTEAIPDVMSIGINSVFPYNYYMGSKISLVSRDRMKYVGYNKYLINIIYCSIGPDNHLYFKSSNPQHKYLEKVQFTGIFEDADEAEELSCNSDGSSCDYLDKKFPLEDSLVPILIQNVVKEVLGVAYRPADTVNNADDDLSDIIQWARQNMKSNLQKQIENGQ